MAAAFPAPNQARRSGDTRIDSINGLHHKDTKDTKSNNGRSWIRRCRRLRRRKRFVEPAFAPAVGGVMTYKALAGNARIAARRAAGGGAIRAGFPPAAFATVVVPVGERGKMKKVKIPLLGLRDLKDPIARVELA